jgi:MFS family permease
LNVLSLQGLPLFSTFFFWSVGMGAMHLARPLFAASFGVSIFFVALITASNGLARLVSGPIVGLLMDRWGRKPLLIFGVVLRGLTGLAEYFATSYLEFLILEFIGGIGVSIWGTGSSIVIADVTGEANRGRAVATRSISMRLGSVSGPFIGGILAALFDLRSIFLFNAVTKLIVLVVLVFLVAETRPEAAAKRAAGRAEGGARSDFSIFFTRSFVVIAIVTFALSLLGAGVFEALFPIYARQTMNVGAAEIGVMLTVVSVTVLLVSFPNGILVDRYGRKKMLVPGLLILAFSAYLLAGMSSLPTAYLAIVVYGIGEAMTMGAAQVYVMDLAPEARRGAFLGVWSLFTNTSAALAPLLAGFLAQATDFSFTFTGISLLVGVSAVVMWLFGPETAAGKRRATAA